MANGFHSMIFAHTESGALRTALRVIPNFFDTLKDSTYKKNLQAFFFDKPLQQASFRKQVHTFLAILHHVKG